MVLVALLILPVSFAAMQNLGLTGAIGQNEAVFILGANPTVDDVNALAQMILAMRGEGLNQPVRVVYATSHTLNEEQRGIVIGGPCANSVAFTLAQQQHSIINCADGYAQDTGYIDRFTSNSGDTFVGVSGDSGQSTLGAALYSILNNVDFSTGSRITVTPAEVTSFNNGLRDGVLLP